MLWEAIVTVVPVGLVLGLLVFGSYGHRDPVPPTPGRVLPLVVLAIVLGPVLLSAVGLFFWIVALAIVAAAVLMFAMLRTPPLRH